MSKRENENNDEIGAAAKLQKTNDVNNFEITFDQNPSPDINFNANMIDSIKGRLLTEKLSNWAFSLTEICSTGLLKYCPKLKSIQFPYGINAGYVHRWLHKNYPKLEHISAPDSFGLTKDD